MSTTIPAEAAPPTGGVVPTPPDTTAEAEGVPVAAPPSAAGTIRCANCGTPLTGRYCSECGQRHFDHPVHHFWHFVSEAFEDLTHADSRLWQTLIALLFRPGFLTREFLDGRRVRYLPPVRLYLVLSVLYFVIAAVVPQPEFQQPIVTQKGSYTVVTPFGVGAVSATQAKRVCVTKFHYTGPLASRFDANCIKALTGNGDLKDNFLHNAGRALFILLPLLALVMKALYRKPPLHYVEHLLFFVHNHAFLFLVLGVEALLTGLGPPWLRPVLHPVVWIYVCVYFYASMLRVYGQGWLLTATKLGALGLAYFVLGSFVVFVTFMYSVLTL